MYIVLGFTIFGFLFGLGTGFYNGEALIGGAIIGMILGLFLGCIIANCNIEETVLELQYTLYLEALQDTQMISGSFWLGCGDVQGKMKYTYYYKTKEGFKFGKVGTARTTIIYSDTKPRIEYYESRNKENKFSFSDGDDWCYKIYVPEGTIKQNFNLDAQ